MKNRAGFGQRLFLVCCALLFFPGAGFAETVFAPRVDYPTTNPFFVAAGDLNSDTHQDLAVANWSANTVTVFLGSGDGTFAPQSPVAVGVHPNSIATGFMNDDPHLDLAVASGGGNRDVKLLLGDGSGGFSSVLPIDVTNNASYPNGDADINYLISGDFDGDGETDLALTKESGYPEIDDHIKIMKGDGLGGFVPLATTSLGKSVYGPYGLAAGNFNGDGHVDLAVTMYDSNAVRIFLNSGAGTFTEAAGSPVTVGATPLRVAAADLDRDGADDLAVTNYGGNTMSVLLGNGDGTFSAAPGSPLATGAGPVGLIAVDMDQDGNPDVVLTNDSSSTFSLFAGNGDGTFQPRQDYGTGAGPNSLVSNDFNGDGKPDLAVTNFAGDSLSVYLRTQCAPPPSGMLSWWAGDGNAADLIGGNQGTPVNGAGYAAGMVGQAFSFDGANDYVDLPAAASTLLNNEAGSIAAWVRPSAVGSDYVNNDMIAVFGSGIDGEGVGLGIWDKVRIYHHTTAYDWQTSTPVAAGEWTHLAYTWDGTTERLYKNGVFSESRPRNFSYVPGAGRIGDGFWGDGANPFPGLIDEVQTYGRTLTAEEIQALYYAGGSGSCRPCLPQDPQALSWWRAEENPDDYHGRNNATLVNGTGYGPGKVGSAFLLDGVNDFVQVQSPTSLPLGNAPRSMDLWFRTPRNLATTQEAALVQYGSTGGSQMFGLIFSGNAPGKLYFYGHGNDLWGTTTVQPDTWYHAAVTFDGAAVNLYLNGRLEASKSTTLDTVLDANGLTIGNRPGSSLWQGELDEVRIHTAALTADQIAAIYNARDTGTCGTCVDRPADMVSWWGGDGNTADISGANDGFLVNGASFATGMVGGSFSAVGANDYLEVPHADDLSFGPADAMSVNLWVYRTSTDASQHILGKRIGCGVNDFNYQLVLDPSNGGICFVSGSTSNMACSSGGDADLPLNTWTNLTGTYDGSQFRVYINGELAGTGTGTLAYENSEPLRLGTSGPVGDPGCGSQDFDGLIDEAAIFSRALTPEEVRSLFNAGSGGMCRSCAARPDGMVSWWQGEGDAADFMGSLDGTFAAATYATGMAGQSFSLDGLDDVVDIPHAIPSALLGSAPKTVTAWVNPSAYPAEIFMMGNTSPSGGSFRLITDAGGQLGFDVSNAVVYSSQVVPLNQWSLVAGTWDGTDYRACLNGTCEVVAGLPAQNLSDQLFTIGKANQYFPGRIDEVTLHASALTEPQLAMIANARSSGMCTAIDTVPDSFAFTDQTGVALNSVITSDSITVTGIDFPTDIAISACTGPGPCQYELNSSGTWLTTPATVMNGDTVTVRQTSSGSYGTQTDVTLDIGGV
ncbi:MAG: LamG-like jellyroll fold domain-containing protein, partial [Thermodesulfobacteriota bacterium]